MTRKRFRAGDHFMLLQRALRVSGRRAAWLALRAGGRMLHPLIGSRAPIGGLSLTRDAVSRRRGQYAPLDPERMVRYGPAASQWFTATPTFCAVLDEARVLGERPAIISADNRLLIDVSPVVAARPWRHPDLMRGLVPPAKRLDGRTAVISSVLANRYYHWMLDILPRLDLIARAQMPFDRLIAQTDNGFQRETLMRLGLRPEQIVSPREGAHFLCERLVTPSLPTPFAKPTPQVCAFLRRVFLPSGAARDAPRVLYISRKHAERRRVLNEDDILARLVKYGVEKVNLEGMGVAEQATLFAQAKIVMGPHGAGFTNMVFASPGATLIEFMPDAFENRCFEILAGLVGANYVCLPSRCGAAPDLDQTVDADAVEIAVEALLLRS